MDMNIYELMEGRQLSIRELAMSIVDRHNRGQPSGPNYKWIQEMALNLNFNRHLRKEYQKYRCLDTPLIDNEHWLDTAYMLCQAMQILEEYRTTLELEAIETKRRRGW